MAALVCDICGGKLIIGDGGSASCEKCGVVYGAEKMKEKAEAVKASISRENNQMLQYNVKAANTAYESGDYTAAEETADKIIAADSSNVEGWFLKGKAVAMQSTSDSLRFSDAIACWKNALNSVPETEKEALKKRLVKDFSEIGKKILQSAVDYFKSAISVKNSDYVIKCASGLGAAYLEFINNLFYFDSNHLFVRVNLILMSASDNLSNDYKEVSAYGYSFQAKERLKEKLFSYFFIDVIACRVSDNPIAVCLAQARMKLVYESLVGGLIDITPSDKTFVTEQYNKAIADSNAAAAAWEEKQEKQKIEKANAYWAEHPEEKKTLDEKQKQLGEKTEQLTKRKQEIDKEIEALEKEANEKVPADDDYQKISSELRGVQSERDALGFFKFKEKQALDEKISQINDRLEQARAKVNRQRNELLEKTNKKKSALLKEQEEVKKQAAEVSEEIDLLIKKLKREE